MPEKERNRSLTEALNSGVRQYGKAIISNLAIAIKTTQLYSFAHQNVTNAFAELESSIAGFIRLEGDCELSKAEEFLFVNEMRVKVDLGGIQPYQLILDLFREREIGSILFKQGVSAAELSKLVDCLIEPPAEKLPWEAFHLLLSKRELRHIEASKYKVRREEQDSVVEDKRLLAISTYFRAIKLMGDTIEAAKGERRLNLKRLKRTIHAMVDMVLEDQPTLLALINIKNYGSRLANHSVNVAVLSLALGAKLGLAKKLLGDLGITGLLHDIGKTALPEELLFPFPRAFTPEEQARYDGHVHAGVELLLNQRIIDVVVKSMNVAFQHHLRFDATGFPRTHVVKVQNFFSRIVAVADYYDNRTTPAPDGTKGWLPDHALRGLMEGGGTEFDPLVVKAFANLMGLYPVGCIVCLDTGELGTVVAPSSNARYIDRPTVKVFADAEGNSVERIVNLMDRDAGGAFPRSILKLYQQEEVQLEMEEYLSVI